jgi:hypothetical protein
MSLQFHGGAMPLLEMLIVECFDFRNLLNF